MITLGIERVKKRGEEINVVVVVVVVVVDLVVVEFETSKRLSYSKYNDHK